MNESKKVGGATLGGRDPKRTARDVIHRCNNFLTVIGTHGETALEMNDAEFMKTALRAIMKEAREVEVFLKESRRSLGD